MPRRGKYMLKFSTYEIKWPDIASVVISDEDTHEV